MARLASGSIDLQSLKVASTVATGYITNIDANQGITIKALGGTTSGSNANYIQLDSNGLKIFKEGAEIASYGDSVIIGDLTGTHFEIDNDSLILRDEINNPTFIIKDSRAEQTDNYGNTYYCALVTEEALGTGTKKIFSTETNMLIPPQNDSTLAPKIYIDTVRQTINEDYTITSQAVTFVNAPSENAKIKIDYYSTANNLFSLSFGHGATTDTSKGGPWSASFGLNTFANGLYSFALGIGTWAAGYASHAEGQGTTASGKTSHAEGISTTASGRASHAEGWGSVAGGEASHAEGIDTIAASDYQTAIGKHNREDTSNIYAFIIGNGTLSSNRSNALTVDWYGDVEYAGCLSPMTASKYIDDKTVPSSSVTGGAINLKNGDMSRINCLYFNDASNGRDDSAIKWPYTDASAGTTQTWDSLWAVGGDLKFAPNNGTAQTVWHSGNFTPSSKQDTITGAASTITSSNLTASKALVSNSSGKVAASSVSSTELGYLSGVSSAIQTQLNGKQATLSVTTPTISKQTITGVSSSSITVKKWGNVVSVDIEIVLSATISSQTTLATGLPAPVSTVRTQEFLPSQTSYTRPLRFILNTSGNLDIRYGAASTTSYWHHFTYISS